MSAVFSVVDERCHCLVDDCDFKSHSLLGHILEVHGMTAEEYMTVHPGAETLSAKALAGYEDRGRSVRRAPLPRAVQLTTPLMGYTVAVDAAVSEDVCLRAPAGYMFPTKGRAKVVYDRILYTLLCGRNCFIWGMPGTGKDAIVHEWSARTRKPVVMVTFRPGTDLAPWFYARSINANGTGWEYGHLWRALTEGIQGRDGVYRPAAILMSDIDRADSAQAEWFRILTDSIEGRIIDPYGKMVPIFPGTQFVCTGNSCGSGDSRGRMASANPIDASILDRLGRKIQSVYLDWEDEERVLRAKYPLVAERAGAIFANLGAATDSLRAAIEKETIYAEFTHRGLCEILSECQDILTYIPAGASIPANLLRRGFKAWLDGLDGETYLSAKRLISPHIKDGAFDDED